MKKNDEFTAEITALTSEGEGICHSDDGMAFFVKGALPGDVLKCGVTKLKRTYGYARLIEIIKPSKDRIEPDCKVFGRCGGCVFRNYSYEAELAFKEKTVKDAVERVGGFSDVNVLPVVGADPLDGEISVRERYRNKAEIPVKALSDGTFLSGFYAGRTHSIIQLPGNDCLLQPEEFAQISTAVLDWMSEKHISAYDEVTGKGLLRHLLIRKSFSTGEILLCLIINSPNIPFLDKLPPDYFSNAGVTTLCINHNDRNTNVILGQKTDVISGLGYITEKIDDLSYRVSAPSFFQVNPVQTRKLYGLVKEYAELKGGDKVWDLYCGTGTIGLFLAKGMPDISLTGIEVIPSAIENAKENADLNGVSNAKFLCGKAEDLVSGILKEDGAPDIVIVDPPRKGCDTACLDTIVNASPKRIVYVSCNPATLARDMKYLYETGGYAPQKITPFDMFPGSGHVETVALLSKLSAAKHHIEVTVEMDELDMSSAEAKATYKEIQEWVQEKYGFHVTNLNIAQVKQRHGIIERENYNKPKSENSKQPGCPEEKVKAIENALRHFQMI